MRVAEYSPMKRGLKVNVGEDGLANGDRCRVFPDEEGTESNNSVFRQSRSTLVAEYSPMKRGLKGNPGESALCYDSRCRVFPDEEGTERAPRARKILRLRPCCRVFPDEEGTERDPAQPRRRCAGIVAEYSPMKRGLKAKRP